MAKEVTSKRSWFAFFGFSPDLIDIFDLDGAARSGKNPARESSANILDGLAANSVGVINIQIDGIFEGDHVGFYPAYTPSDANIHYLSCVAGAGYVAIYWGNSDGATANESAVIDGYVVHSKGADRTGNTIRNGVISST